MEKPEKTTTDPVVPIELSEMSVKQLQEEVTKLGMPAEDASKLKTTGVLISVINTLKTNKVAVVSSTSSVDPNEEKKTKKNWINKAHKQWLFWNEQPKVKIIVPLNGQEKKGVIRWETHPAMKIQVPVHVSGAVQSVIENGARYFIPKGVYVEVPEPVAKIIEAKFQQTSDAGSDILADRIDPDTGKPVSEQL